MISTTTGVVAREIIETYRTNCTPESWRRLTCRISCHNITSPVAASFSCGHEPPDRAVLKFYVLVALRIPVRIHEPASWLTSYSVLLGGDNIPRVAAKMWWHFRLSYTALAEEAHLSWKQDVIYQHADATN